MGRAWGDCPICGVPSAWPDRRSYLRLGTRRNPTPPPRPIGKLRLTEGRGEGGRMVVMFLVCGRGKVRTRAPPSKSGTFLAGGEEQWEGFEQK